LHDTDMLVVLAASSAATLLLAPSRHATSLCARRAPPVALNLRAYIVAAADAAAKQAAAEEAEVAANAEGGRFDAVPPLEFYNDALASESARESARFKDAATMVAAAKGVHAAAAKLGEDRLAFAEKWTARLLDGGDDAISNAETFLIDECLIDDSPCEELEAAIRELQVLRGKWSGINA
jgi:hypothetical protein